ncbi:MAG: hypothetical protein QM775_31745 [Pirellulales bacterium]
MSATSWWGWPAVVSSLGVALIGCAVQAEAGDGVVPLKISGGHEIDRQKDFGRPVVLIAAALGVKPDVFREAFSGVTPSRGGPPSREEAQRNKDALMRVLAPHGITNDRLDEVSNYYRYRPQDGQLWSHEEAAGHAVVIDGKVTKIVVTKPGAGYTTPPTITVPGYEQTKLTAKLHFDRDLKKNGSIAAIDLAK